MVRAIMALIRSHMHGAGPRSTPDLPLLSFVFSFLLCSRITFSLELDCVTSKAKIYCWVPSTVLTIDIVDAFN